MNLKKGTITVPPGEGEAVQHISLAFVTATLYLLVQPRPKMVSEVRPGHTAQLLNQKKFLHFPCASSEI